jgi:SAM-dependent methyltransferase
MRPNEEVMAGWSDSAPFWEKHREVVRQMFAPVTRALVEDGLIGGGQTVLDIATGPGEPALSVTDLVGREGRVVGVDPVPEMVAAARRAAERLGLRNAEFEVAFPDDLPFPDDAFDAVISRFGVMFFPSPVEGVREMMRVLKPGRKLALAVWSLPANNPFFYSLSKVIERYAGPPRPPEPDALEPFRFARPGKLRDILLEAGAMDVSERLMPFAIEAPISPEAFWTVRSDMSDTFRAKIATFSEEQLAAVKRDGVEAFREYSTDRGMSFPAEVLIVTGTKGASAA